MTTAPRPLVHTRTTAYRHDSVPAGLGALPALDGLAADATEGPAAPEAPLDGCGAVVFLSTSGEIPTPSGRARLAACVEAGGGFARVHAAARTEDDWPPYGTLRGARLDSHPAPSRGTSSSRTATTRHRPPVWACADERYGFRSNPRGTVLARADGTSYEGGRHGRGPSARPVPGAGPGPRPLHRPRTHRRVLRRPAFREHPRGGIRWAARHG
ncbi:ThuA domain-containing protein [Streptomyces sp. TP-A0875]|uniref:ThuA domain-containing protein n=1 Tax=Streptomyces sp. TP-A0875 TaxID=552354 RepID=UPI00099CF19A|nr:ThuA domain-containing protein [Streptomyces sp. TP-A0875]